VRRLLTSERRTVLAGVRFRRSGRTDLSEQQVASFLTKPAGLCTNPAVVVVIAVELALVGRRLARENAGMQLRVDNFVGCFCLSDNRARGCGANVGANQVGCNTTPESFEVLRFPEASI